MTVILCDLLIYCYFTCAKMMRARSQTLIAEAIVVSSYMSSATIIACADYEIFFDLL